jgi:hypothetical protein
MWTDEARRRSAAVRALKKKLKGALVAKKLTTPASSVIPKSQAKSIASKAAKEAVKPAPKKAASGAAATAAAHKRRAAAARKAAISKRPLGMPVKAWTDIKSSLSTAHGAAEDGDLERVNEWVRNASDTFKIHFDEGDTDMPEPQYKSLNQKSTSLEKYYRQLDILARNRMGKQAVAKRVASNTNMSYSDELKPRRRRKRKPRAV